MDCKTLAELYSPGALYIAGFTQARAPHLGLLFAKDSSTGILWHIRIDRATSPHWKFQRRVQAIAGDMFLSSLLLVATKTRLGDKAEAKLEAAARFVEPPSNDSFGECAPWVFNVLAVLHDQGVVKLVDQGKLAMEVDTFARQSRPYAQRDHFPNLAVSSFCH
ncbi:hypothetical protein BDQ12DRAFT_690298 [Crucibulum laeve]|uniref:Uncharacterized protein n=1 Tax=Crucibulum laeve TaxID=68775 RepID=A0A5C3LLK6_9AGAR|nr:hypothetical protein BDQ12DRAFT_690298 [Crucibulum laeve]